MVLVVTVVSTAKFPDCMGLQKVNVPSVLHINGNQIRLHAVAAAENLSKQPGRQSNCSDLVLLLENSSGISADFLKC